MQDVASPQQEVDIEMREYNQTSGFGPVFSAVTAMVSPAHQTITRQPLYERVAPLEINPGFTTIVHMFLDQFHRWHRRADERRALMALDDRMLQDIGVEKADALDEGAKPFWRV